MLKLVCTQPFHGYERGQQITDQTLVASLSLDREGNFVRVTMTPDEEQAEIARANPPPPEQPPPEQPA